MKNNFKILVLSIVLVIGAGYGLFTYRNKSAQNLSPTDSLSPDAEIVVESPGDNQDTTTENNEETLISLVAEFNEQTALELLTDNAEVEYEEYDFGVFIKSINDIKNDDQNYWAFYVNGEYAQSGADQVNLQKGDLIEFKYVAIEEANF